MDALECEPLFLLLPGQRSTREFLDDGQEILQIFSPKTRRLESLPDPLPTEDSLDVQGGHELPILFIQLPLVFHGDVPADYFDVHLVVLLPYGLLVGTLVTSFLLLGGELLKLDSLPVTRVGFPFVHFHLGYSLLQGTLEGDFLRCQVFQSFLFYDAYHSVGHVVGH